MVTRSRIAIVSALAVYMVTSVAMQAQGRGAAPATPPTPRAMASIDLTGYWVAVISEDWRWRMVTPPKGDYASIPLNVAGKNLADTWDPAKDEAAGVSGWLSRTQWTIRRTCRSRGSRRSTSRRNLTAPSGTRRHARPGSSLKKLRLP